MEGEVREDFGDPSAEEAELGFKFFDFGSVEAQDEDYADREMLGEEHVMKLAAAWSVDPSGLGSISLEVEAGILGRIALPEPRYHAAEPKAMEAGEVKQPPLTTSLNEGERPWWRFW